MSMCPSCGGIIGRDCFNPVECAWITQSMNEQSAVDDYIHSQNRKAEKKHYEQQQKEYNDYMKADYENFIIGEHMANSNMLTRFLITT